MKVFKFFSKLHLKWKLIFNILITATFVYVGIISIVIYISKQANLDFYEGKAETESEFYASHVSEYLNTKYAVADNFAGILNFYTEDDNFQQVFDKHSSFILQSNVHIKAAWVVLIPQGGQRFDKKNRSLSFHNKIFLAAKERQNEITYLNNIGQSASSTPEVLRNFVVAEKEYITNPFYISYTGTQENEIYICRLSIPIFNKGIFKGIAGIDLDLQSIEEIIDDIRPLEKGYAFVCSSNSTYVAHIDKKLIGGLETELFSDYSENHNLGYIIRTGKLYSFLFELKNKVQKELEDRDFTSYRTYVPVKIGKTEQYWSVAVIYPMDQIIEKINYSILIFIIIGIVGIIIMMLSSLYISSFITKPMVEINDALKHVAKGDVFSLQEFTTSTQDEVGELKASVNTLRKGLRQIANFAQAIGGGNLEKEFSPLSKKDIIGISLLEMQANLQKAYKEEAKRRVEDKKRQWFTQGLTLFEDIMRSHNNHLENLTDSILSNLIHYLKANQGGIFIYNNDNKDDIHLNLAASYAYDSKKFIDIKILMGEGIVGTCAVEKKTIHLNEVPRGYMEVTSGLGSENPHHLLLVPMLVDDDIFGVIELASFEPFTKDKIEFVEKIATNVATIMTSVKTNHRTNELLDLSRQQTEEMAMKEEEMLQSMEQLKTTQEEMILKNEKIEKTQLQLREEQAFFDVLLKEIDIFIYFKDTEGRFMKCSKSLCLFLGYENIEDIIGKTDFDIHPHKVAQETWKVEQELLKTGKAIYEMIEKQEYHDGTVAWISTVKLPIYSVNNEIKGIVGVSKDVTEYIGLQDELKNTQTILKSKTERYKKEIELLKMEDLKSI